MARRLAFAVLIAALAAAPAAAAAVGNGRIAFVSSGDLWTVEADGSSASNLTQGRVGEVNGPVAWSPDGALVASSSREGPFVIAADGSGLVDLPAVGAPTLLGRPGSHPVAQG